MNLEINDDGVLGLGDHLDIAHATALKAGLEELLEREGDLALDGSAVIRSDAAGLQLLLAFMRHCRDNDRSCAWQGASEVLKMDAAGLGLASELEINPQDQGGQE